MSMVELVSTLAMTPDGKSVLAYTGAGEIVRWNLLFGGGSRPRVTFKLDQVGPSIAVGKPLGLVMSVDGSKTALISSEGNKTSAANHPTVDAYSTYIYATGDLSRPLRSITPGRGATTIAFDTAGRAYSNNAARDLIRFTEKGEQDKEYNLGGGTTQAILVQPDTRGVVVFTEKKCFALEPVK